MKLKRDWGDMSALENAGTHIEILQDMRKTPEEKAEDERRQEQRLLNIQKKVARAIEQMRGDF